MNGVPKATLIVNPRSGKRGALRALREVLAALAKAGYETEVRVTERVAGAAPLAAEAARAGQTALVTLGGDGTVSEAVNGVLSLGAWPDELAIAPLPLGTGNSFVRQFGPRTGEWQLALSGLTEGRRRWIDAGRIRWRLDGVEQTRVFVNVFGTGFMAQVADVTNRRLKPLGGQGYTVGVLWQLIRLQLPATRLTVDGGVREEGRISLVAVCNTQWTGENMWIAPRADPADGQLDVLCVGDLSRFDHLRLFPRIFNGTHVEHPAVRSYRGRQVVIEPSEPSPLLVDGEVLGTTPVDVEVVPRAVQLAI